MLSQLTQFRAGDESLEGRFLLQAEDSSPKLLMLHGAGESTKDRALPLASRLASDFGISSFAFDFSGHGNSSGQLKLSSLAKRLHEAEAAISVAGLDTPLNVCAFSMGGHTALELAARYPTNAVILFYPAIYPDEALQASFDGEFSRIIRTPGLWQSSHLFSWLGEYHGSLLVVIGEEDAVIPRELPGKLLSAAKVARSTTLITVPKATHNLLTALYNDPPELQRVLNAIATCLGIPVSESRFLV